MPGNNRELIPVTEQCTAGCPTNGNIQGLVYRAQNWNTDYMSPNRWNVSATYLTGGHSMKVGYIGAYYWVISLPSTNNTNLAYRFNNAIPNQISELIRNYEADTRVRMNALYWQDTYTKGRLTLQGALRYDHAWSYYPAQRWARRGSCRRRSCSPKRRACVGYNDIDPRFGVAYDLFGNGKTAIKVNVGRYLEAAVGGNGNYSSLLPSSRVTTTVTRTWTDAQRQLRPQLRPEQPAGPGQSNDWRRFLRPDLGPELREARQHACLTTRTSSRAGTTGRTTGSSARPCSMKSCRASRSRRATRGAGSSTSR